MFRALLLLLLLLPGVVHADSGRILYVSGKVTVERSGQLYRVVKNARIREGDVLETGAAGRVHLRMSDETLISLKPGTRFQIESYRFKEAAGPAFLPSRNNAADSGADRSVFGLFKGGFRAITGLIGQRNKTAFGVNTPVATIGIRGTTFMADLVEIEPANLADEANLMLAAADVGPAARRFDVSPLQLAMAAGQPASPQWRLSVGVGKGSVVVRNETGQLILENGEFGVVRGKSAPPRRSLKPGADEEAKADKKATEEDQEEEESELAEEEGGEEKQEQSEQEVAEEDAAGSQATPDEPDADDGSSQQAAGEGDDEAAGTKESADPPSGSSQTAQAPATTEKSDGSGTAPEKPSGSGSTSEQAANEQIATRSVPEDRSSSTPGFGQSSEHEAEQIVVEDTEVATAKLDLAVVSSIVTRNGRNSLGFTSPLARTAGNGAGHIRGFEAGVQGQATGSKPAQIKLDNGQVVNTGYDQATGLRWGRWAGNSASLTRPDAEPQTLDPIALQMHLVHSASRSGAIALPTTGSRNFSLVGNTDPTDSAGRIGVLGDARLQANFDTGQVSSTLALSINQQVWQASGTGSLGSGTPSGTPAHVFEGSYNSVSVAGQTGGAGSFSGFLTNQAAGAGLSYQLRQGGQTVHGAAALRATGN